MHQLPSSVMDHVNATDNLPYYNATKNTETSVQPAFPVQVLPVVRNRQQKVLQIYPNGQFQFGFCSALIPPQMGPVHFCRQLG